MQVCQSTRATPHTNKLVLNQYSIGIKEQTNFYTVDGILLPVVNVNDPDAEDEPLQLTLVEHLDEVQWNELAEAGQEMLHLFRKK